MVLINNKLNITEKEIMATSVESRDFDDGLFPNWTDANIWDGAFLAGVNFALGKVEEVL